MNQRRTCSFYVVRHTFACRPDVHSFGNLPAVFGLLRSSRDRIVWVSMQASTRPRIPPLSFTRNAACVWSRFDSASFSSLLLGVSWISDGSFSRLSRSCLHVHRLWTLQFDVFVHHEVARRSRPRPRPVFLDPSNPKRSGSNPPSSLSTIRVRTRVGSDCPRVLGFLRLEDVPDCLRFQVHI